MTSTSASLRAADARLLLPGPMRRVQLVGEVTGWRAALDALGIAVTDEQPDLAVGASGRAVAASGAPHVLVLGEARRVLQRAGYSTRTVLARAGTNGPRVYVPVEYRVAWEHAFTAPIVGRSAVHRLLARGAATAARIGLPLPGVVTFGSQTTGAPQILEAARVETREWYLFTGEGDDRQRMVWFCFDGGEAPSRVVKCGRVPGYHDAFDRDENVLRMLDELPDDLRQHAPHLLTRVDMDGLPVSVETAAPGQPLYQRLTMTHVSAVADWIVEVGRATARPPQQLDDSLPPIAPVLQHNDLGCWNIIVTADSFVIVDWESGRREGLPLWDLAYFLTDALSSLAARGDERAKEAAMLALLRGELDSSQLLFDRVRDAATVAGVPPAAVGTVVSLCWQHHARSAGQRDADAGPLTRLAAPWMADPRLGESWPAFTGS